MTRVYPAKTLRDAFNACHPEDSIEAGDPRFVDLTDVRGGENIARAIAKSIMSADSRRFSPLLFTGHFGSGKSTELHRVRQFLREDGFFVVFVDVENVLNLGDIEYLDVLVALAKEIEESVREEGMAISPSRLEELEQWFSDTVIAKDDKTDATLGFSGGVEAEAKVPFLLKVFARMTSELHVGSSRRTEIRQKLEPQLSVFIARLNDLIGAARSVVQERGYSNIAVIVDGLEKMNLRDLGDGRTSHSALFVEHAEQLKAPECHLVYTVPISLCHSENLINSFSSRPEILPMVNYVTDTGQERLRELVSRRVDVATLFESSELVDELIFASGGCVRDLLVLIQDAYISAEEKIALKDVQRAIRRLTDLYDRLILDEEIPVLVEVEATKELGTGPHAARLLHLRIVQEYMNAKRWRDLHPAVRRSPRVRRALDAAKGKDHGGSGSIAPEGSSA